MHWNMNLWKWVQDLALYILQHVNMSSMCCYMLQSLKNIPEKDILCFTIFLNENFALYIVLSCSWTKKCVIRLYLYYLGTLHIFLLLLEKKKQHSTVQSSQISWKAQSRKHKSILRILQQNLMIQRYHRHSNWNVEQVL